MKNIIKNIKQKVILLCFSANILLCFASCAYFSAAESKVQEYREMRREAEGLFQTPDLTGDMDINDLHIAVEEELQELEQKSKRKKPAVFAKAQF